MSDARFEGAFSVNGHNPSFSGAKSEYSPSDFSGRNCYSVSARLITNTAVDVRLYLCSTRFVIKALFPCVYADSIHQDILLRSR